jgi:NDP-sugar pyrophosphorylase family protein
MQAVLLVGGKGMRLQSIAPDVPKPLVPVGGVPFLKYQLAWLAHEGVREVLLCAGHKADHFRAWLPTVHTPALEITLLVEPEPRGTGGALRFAAPHLEEQFLVLNGDTFCEVNLVALEQFHRDRAALATVTLWQVEDVSQRGTVTQDGAGRVTGFVEKQVVNLPGVVNGGVYVLQRAVLDYIPPERPSSLEYEVFPRLVQTGRMFGKVFEGYFVDMGTPAGLADAHAHLPALFAARGWL